MHLGDGQRGVCDQDRARGVRRGDDDLQLVFCILRSAILCERLRGQRACAPLDQAEVARRGGAGDRFEGQRGLGGLAAREQDAALRFVEEFCPRVELERPGSVHASLGLVEQAHLDQRLDSDCECVTVWPEPGGVRDDLAREIDRFIDAAGFQSEPYLGTRVVDDVLELRTLRRSGKGCLGFVQPPEFKQNLGALDLGAPAHLVTRAA